MTPPTIDPKRVDKVARCFDGVGRLLRWPSKRADQLLVLGVVWSYLPEDRQMTETEVSSMLRDGHDCEDFALLRRELCDLDLPRRTPDGRVCRHIAHVPGDVAARLADTGHNPS